MAAATQTLHASAVAVSGRGCLIVGKSGAGKSTLALEMISAGAALISDDQTVLRCDGGETVLQSPAQTAGMIEVYGVGMIRLPHSSARLSLVVDLDRAAGRMPPRRYRHLLGCVCPVILGHRMKGLSSILALVLGHCDEIPAWTGVNVSDGYDHN